MSESNRHTDIPETRARRRIRQAVESRGFKLVSLEWTPRYDGGEKSGTCGGWYGEVDRPTRENTFPSNDLMGLSVDETIAWVDDFFPTPEPCDCKRPEHYSALVSGEPLSHHDEGCRWHLRYTLPWWPR